MTLEEALQHGIADQTGRGDCTVFIEVNNGHYTITSEDVRPYAECESLADVYQELAQQAPELSPTGWDWFKPISATSKTV